MKRWNFRAGERTDCHASDVGHWLAMRGGSAGRAAGGVGPYGLLTGSCLWAGKRLLLEEKLSSGARLMRWLRDATSSDIRLAGDGGCHLPLKGKARGACGPGAR